MFDILIFGDIMRKLFLVLMILVVVSLSTGCESDSSDVDVVDTGVVADVDDNGGLQDDDVILTPPALPEE